VIHSRDHEEVGMAHEIASPKHLPFSPDNSIRLGKTKPKQATRTKCNGGYFTFQMTGKIEDAWHY